MITGEILLILIFIVIPIFTITGILLVIRFIIRAAKEKPKQELKQKEIADELKKLAELHEQGVLTDEEFYEQKKKLLR
jgi:uncharacterized membrane protein